MSDELPYRVTAVDPRTGQRVTYGAASDRHGADSLVASAKVQNVAYRNIRMEKRTAAQQDMLDGRGGWVEVP